MADHGPGFTLGEKSGSSSQVQVPTAAAQLAVVRNSGGEEKALRKGSLTAAFAVCQPRRVAVDTLPSPEPGVGGPQAQPPPSRDRFEAAFADCEKRVLFRACTPSAALTREDLAELHVVAQVESKFIVARLGQDKLVLLDQHAAAERVELETLQQRVVKGDASVIEPVAVPGGGARISVTTEEFRCLEKHRVSIERWGFRWSQPPAVVGNSASATSAPGLVVTHVPDILGSQLAPTDLRTVLAEVDASSGTTTAMPRVVRHILAFKACRRSVKFGDAMSMREMSRLSRELSGCELPFQCAHGRPTIYPLFSIPALLELGGALQRSSARTPPLKRFLEGRRSLAGKP
mmetsp:Transcript_143870/g.460570  ORF Transcript_143870/g.460570 Transcript_143870/m.460570 type:complete len:346 (+) Transcript_143870:1-1038(+)